MSDPTSPVIIFFICYPPQSHFVFLYTTLSTLGQHLLKPRIQPSAHSERHLEGLHIENDLQSFPCGVEDNAASPAPRDVIFECPPEVCGPLLVDIVWEMGHHFFATSQRHSIFLT